MGAQGHRLIRRQLLLHADAAEEQETLPRAAVAQLRSVSSSQQDAAQPLDAMWLTNITIQGNSDGPVSGALIQGRMYAEGVHCCTEFGISLVN